MTCFTSTAQLSYNSPHHLGFLFSIAGFENWPIMLSGQYSNQHKLIHAKVCILDVYNILKHRAKLFSRMRL